MPEIYKVEMCFLQCDCASGHVSAQALRDQEQASRLRMCEMQVQRSALVVHLLAGAVGCSGLQHIHAMMRVPRRSIDKLWIEIANMQVLCRLVAVANDLVIQ